MRCLIFWLIAPALWAASDVIVETDLAADLSAGLRQGSVLRLESSGRSFVAIFDRSHTAETRGVAILLPEAGLRADAGIMKALRKVLPDHGWNTLSVQLPVLETEATGDEYLTLLPDSRRRIGAAVGRMKAEGMTHIALIGHGLGALAALSYIGLDDDDSIQALVLLSPWWPRQKDESLASWLAGVSIPVLDIRAERDQPRILATADDRQLLLKGRIGDRHWRISGVGHHYRGREEALAKRIYGWLQAVAPGKEVAR